MRMNYHLQGIDIKENSSLILNQKLIRLHSQVTLKPPMGTVPNE